MLRNKAKHLKKESFIMAKKVKISNNTVAAVLYVLVGVLFCIFKASMLNWLLTAAGIVFIVLGVLDILKKNLVNGIVEAVIGVVILVGGWAFVEVALIIFGALLVIKGVLDLMAAIKAKAGIFTMIAAVITAVVGVLLIASKWVMLDWFFIVMGVILIVDGALMLIKK